MRFQRKFQVRAPRDAVVEFHRRSDSLAAITPPVIPMQLELAPQRLTSGDQLIFTLWLGPLPVRWRAFISQVSPTGFSDHQWEGPFRYWVHHHTFVPLDANTTEVVDDVRAALKWHAWWGTIGLALWVGLPLLFAFRAWKTQSLLEDSGPK